LPVEGENEKKWELIVSINPGGPNGGSAVQYFIGDFDGINFTCDDVKTNVKWADYGHDFYAVVTCCKEKDRKSRECQLFLSFFITYDITYYFYIKFPLFSKNVYDILSS
jgi:sucrose-6-phosphate hydrolase SacC (GH32 family)